MMDIQAFDAVTRRAAEGISRRHSLLALGGVAAGAVLARPVTGEAKKKKNKKCKKKEKRRCKADAAACKVSVQATCQPPTAPECLVFLSCCDTCSADGFISCMIENAIT